MRWLKWPTVRSVAERQLYEAQRELLEAEKQCEYATGLREILQARVDRLTYFVENSAIELDVRRTPVHVHPSVAGGVGPAAATPEL